MDAGYLLAAGGLLVCGTKRRKDFTCDYERQIEALVEVARELRGDMPVLRTYWYDGAPNIVPTADHLRIAELPYVKIRLGRIIKGKQKGVDALIYRDLMTLARERAIARAILVAGDEDLREGVVAAQDMGVEVVLVGIKSSRKANQSAALIREADEHVMLPLDFWSPFFSLIEPPGEDAAEAEGTSTAATAAGEGFAEEWLARSEPDEVIRLLKLQPRIPRELDVQLLLKAEETTGSLRERQDLKHEIRAAFWRLIEAAGSAVASGEAPSSSSQGPAKTENGVG